MRIQFECTVKDEFERSVDVATGQVVSDRPHDLAAVLERSTGAPVQIGRTARVTPVEFCAQQVSK